MTTDEFTTLVNLALKAKTTIENLRETNAGLVQDVERLRDENDRLKREAAQMHLSHVQPKPE